LGPGKACLRKLLLASGLFRGCLRRGGGFLEFLGHGLELVAVLLVELEDIGRKLVPLANGAGVLGAEGIGLLFVAGEV
jgi:hypothetical protein